MQSLLATAFSFVPPLVDAQDHDVRCACPACGVWRLAARPEPSDADRERAAVALAEEAEDAALLADEWTPVDPARRYWRDPYSHKVLQRDRALDLHARDAVGAL
jgi:predicted  nucleic acid-binding Zn-ribbon protein